MCATPCKGPSGASSCRSSSNRTNQKHGKTQNRNTSKYSQEISECSCALPLICCANLLCYHPDEPREQHAWEQIRQEGHVGWCTATLLMCICTERSSTHIAFVLSNVLWLVPGGKPNVASKFCKSRLKLSKSASKRVPDDERWLLHAASLGY